ncbi:MAG: thiamine-phosphate kinase [Euryarchaeota archaeon]|nr:thiamine-phosphate kinase [Euryarchaeota archaeon]
MTRLDERGERWMVGRIQRLLGDRTVGDDTAYIPWGRDYLLATTDATTIRTHYPWHSPEAWGWYVAAVNLSDIACKGGEPLGLLLSLLLPRETEVATVEGIMRGAKRCCARYGTKVAGGDTKEGREICLVGAAFGRVGRAEFMPRGGARPGDILALTGTLGAAASGYIALQEGVTGPGLRGEERRLLRPYPRVFEGRAAARTRAVHACTDLSDGLLASVHQLCLPSGVGAEVMWEAVPVSAALRRRGQATEEWALGFGGDFELLMAVPPGRFDKVRRAVRGKGTRLTAIGSVRRERKVELVGRGWRRPLKYGGWEHFRGGG